MAKVMLIGNGPSLSDVSGLCLYADLVIRFNACCNMFHEQEPIDILSMVDGAAVPDAILKRVKRVWVPNIWMAGDDRAAWINEKLAGVGVQEVKYLFYKPPAEYRGKGPSSGFTVLQHVLHAKEFAGWQIELAQFTWQGNEEWHDWAFERGVCEELAKHGRITIYP